MNLLFKDRTLEQRDKYLERGAIGTTNPHSNLCTIAVELKDRSWTKASTKRAGFNGFKICRFNLVHCTVQRPHLYIVLLKLTRTFYFKTKGLQKFEDLNKNVSQWFSKR